MWDPILIEAEWGTFQCDTAIQFLNQVICQLQYYLDGKMSPNPEFTKKDIEGYRMVVATGNERTALDFLDEKPKIKNANKSATNLDVVEHMKQIGKWDLCNHKLDKWKTCMRCGAFIKDGNEI